MLEIQLGYLALSLCVIIAVSLVIGLIFKILKKSKVVLAAGLIALLSTIVSLVIYYYLRFTLSGGTLQDGRIVFVLFMYAVAAILSTMAIVDSAKKQK